MSFSDKYIEMQAEKIMEEYILNEIKLQNDSIWELFEKEKSNELKLFEEFETEITNKNLE